jgi:hypothetical protein
MVVTADSANCHAESANHPFERELFREPSDNDILLSIMIRYAT